MGHRGKILVFAFLFVSEHFESIETHFFFENFRERETLNARAKRARCEREYAAPDCDTSDSDLLVIAAREG